LKIPLSIERQSFVQQFLLPLSKLTEKIILTINSDNVVATCSTADSAVVLCAEYTSSFDVKNSITLNIPDIKKFLKLLDNLKDDVVLLNYNNNHLSYSSKEIKFKYYLLEDGYVQRCPISASKIQALVSDSSFILSTNCLSEILKGQSIASDAGKVYFYIQDGSVYAELNDRERSNINNIAYFVCDEFEGTEFTPLAVDLEALRMLTGLRNDTFVVKINTKLNVLLFDVESLNVKTRFAISALVK